LYDTTQKRMDPLFGIQSIELGQFWRCSNPAIYMGGQNLQNHAQSDMIFRLILFYINGNLIKYCWLLFLHVLYLIASL